MPDERSFEDVKNEFRQKLTERLIGNDELSTEQKVDGVIALFDQAVEFFAAKVPTLSVVEIDMTDKFLTQVLLPMLVQRYQPIQITQDDLESFVRDHPKMRVVDASENNPELTTLMATELPGNPFMAYQSPDTTQ